MEDILQQTERPLRASRSWLQGLLKKYFASALWGQGRAPNTRSSGKRVPVRRAIILGKVHPPSTRAALGVLYDLL